MNDRHLGVVFSTVMFLQALGLYPAVSYAEIKVVPIPDARQQEPPSKKEKWRHKKSEDVGKNGKQPLLMQDVDPGPRPAEIQRMQ